MTRATATATARPATARPAAPAAPDDAAFGLHAELCKVLTDPKRLLLIDALRHADRSVGELAEEIGVSLPNASQHLSVLRHAGLVAARREGTTVYYRLVEPRIADACDIVHRIVADRLGGASAPQRRAPTRRPPAQRRAPTRRAPAKRAPAKRAPAKRAPAKRATTKRATTKEGR